MVCGNCGASNVEGAKFCTTCGSSIEAAAAPAAPVATTALQISPDLTKTSETSTR